MAGRKKKTMDRFLPTHEITLSDTRDGAVKPSIYVCLIDGAAYTIEEWNSETNADWEFSEDDGWTFQGRTTPAPHLAVTVRGPLTAPESKRRGREEAKRAKHQVA